MSLIPGFFLDCVVAIGVRAHNRINWIGTGFVVAPGEGQETFLVTNRHVLKGNDHVFLRFNYFQELKSKDYLVEFSPKGQAVWLGHEEEKIDVAAFRIDQKILKDEGIRLFFFQLDKNALLVADMSRVGLSEGDSVFFLGFPMGLVSDVKKYNHVIARNAVLSRVKDVFNSERNNFIIDGNVMPGNSGSPVITRPEIIAIEGTKPFSKACLIGVLKGYIPYADIAVSKQTGRERIRFEENSGLAIVETVDSIKETINLFFKKSIIKQDKI
jgi:hypothetical protein